MKRALIAIASVGLLTSTAWVVAANAQANVNANERYAAPGPIKRGNMCVKDVDSTRGYGVQQPCPAPKAAASAAPRAAAPNAAASASTRALSARASAAPRAAAPTRKQKVVKHSQ